MMKRDEKNAAFVFATRFCLQFRARSRNVPMKVIFQPFGQISLVGTFPEFLTSLLSIGRMWFSTQPLRKRIVSHPISITWTNVAWSRQKWDGGCGCSQGRTCRVKNDPLRAIRSQWTHFEHGDVSDSSAEVSFGHLQINNVPRSFE